MSNTEKNQFHESEIAVQKKLGVADMVAQYSAGFVRPAMPQQHRDFFTQLPLIIVGIVDQDGYPWAMPLSGLRGFIQSPDAKTLSINSLPELSKTLNLDFNEGQKIGLVGIDLKTRRRNRMNGLIENVTGEGFSVHVEQSFGNCPQYIQKRDLQLIEGKQKKLDVSQLELENGISAQAVALLQAADTFFIASRTKVFSSDERSGIDASHRGGRPGFVKIENNTLFFPDFSGNRFFNTLGNIKSDGRVGLFFPDFSTGNAVFLSGYAEIIWDEDAAAEFDGAERIISVKLRNSLFIEQFLPVTGELEEISPSLAGTGVWERNQLVNSDYRTLRLAKKVKESRDITSFYFEPTDSTSLSAYLPGQFLPVAIQARSNQQGSAPIMRSYTLSRAHEQGAYRISVKREEQGLASRILHDELNIGDSIYAGQPAGQFTLNNNDHSIVLLSGGVGITPMLAMLQGLIRAVENGAKPRNLWFIHGTNNTSTHAFARDLKALSERYSWLQVYTVFSRPGSADRANQDYDHSGRISVDLLKKILPFDNYDFYLCGSESFMQSLYSGLLATGVSKDNIFYEFFGEGTLEQGSTETEPTAEKARVHFAKSDITATWTPDDGSLLELAEQNGLQPMYSCRSGNCGACSCQITEGNVSYQQPPGYQPETGSVLICSARPAAHCDSIILDL